MHPRREYEDRPLRRSDLKDDPIELFLEWYGEAREIVRRDPDAMTLATAGEDGMPSARIVLLRGIDPRGFAFYTNYEGAKARELDHNPRAALAIHWKELDRQVRIQGAVTRTSPEESDEYFASRPRPAQLAACISRQSEPVESRDALEKEWRAIESEFPSEVPRPAFWGGYRVEPQSIEFWQGRPGRLHDRFRYERTSGGRPVERLAP